MLRSAAVIVMSWVYFVTRQLAGGGDAKSFSSSIPLVQSAQASCYQRYAWLWNC